MKHLLLAAALGFSMLSVHAADANYNVVPLPKSVMMAKGKPFNLTSATTIVYEGTNPEMKRAVPLRVHPASFGHTYQLARQAR